VAGRYGLSYALLRAKDVAGAQRQMDALKALTPSSVMIPGLAAEIRIAAGDPPAAQAIYLDALQRYSQSRSLVYGYAEALYAGRQYDQALRFLESQLQLYSSDYKLYGLQAKTYAAAGKRSQQHRAQAEFYVLQGQLGEAVEQLQYAQRAGDGNFYEQSVVDARLRELRRQQLEEAKQKKDGG
jgi:predicted Zn-dependent protease